MIKSKNTGFTLIELLVVVVIVGIIAAIAYPNYTNSVRNARAEAAKACLVEVAQALERRYANNLSYAGVTVANTNARCLTDPVSNFYTFAYTPEGTTLYSLTASTPNPATRAFMLEAVPIPGTGQENHRCMAFVLNQAGERDAAQNNCW